MNFECCATDGVPLCAHRVLSGQEEAPRLDGPARVERIALRARRLLWKLRCPLGRVQLDGPLSGELFKKISQGLTNNLLGSSIHRRNQRFLG